MKFSWRNRDKWAVAYKLQPRVTTNNHAESFFSMLKDYELDGRSVQDLHTLFENFKNIGTF